MNTKTYFSFILILTIAFFSTAMTNRSQYDKEASTLEKAQQAEEKAKKEDHITGVATPVKGIVTGIKEATVDSATGLVSETMVETTSEPPLVGTLEGARKATGTVLDKTVKGISRIATLGYGKVETYEVKEPEAGSDEPTKITIKLPKT